MNESSFLDDTRKIIILPPSRGEKLFQVENSSITFYTKCTIYIFLSNISKIIYNYSLFIFSSLLSKNIKNIDIISIILQTFTLDNLKFQCHHHFFLNYPTFLTRIRDNIAS